MKKRFNLNLETQSIERKLASNQPSNCGYSLTDISFLAKNISKEQKIGYLDTLDIIDTDDTEHTAQKVKQAAQQQEQIICGMTPVLFNSSFANGPKIILEETVKYQTDPETPLHKVTMPLLLSYPPNPKKVSHYLSLCSDYNRKTDTMNVVILEQWAKRDGSTLDFSNEIQIIASDLNKIYTQHGIQNINISTNNQTLCRNGNVCGIVALETCKKLIAVEDIATIASDIDYLTLTAQDIQNAHAQNLALSQGSNAPISKYN